MHFFGIRKEWKAKKRRSQITSSSLDNPKCLSASIMIALNLEKIKSNLPSSFQEQLKVYSEILNYGPLQCPHCHSSNVICWGSYERNVIFFILMSNF